MRSTKFEPISYILIYFVTNYIKNQTCQTSANWRISDFLFGFGSGLIFTSVWGWGGGQSRSHLHCILSPIVYYRHTCSVIRPVDSLFKMANNTVLRGG